MNEPSTSTDKKGVHFSAGSLHTRFLDLSSDEIKLKKLIENRASEIALTIEDAKKKMQMSTAQQLPRHMRRRSVSHNVKRLPRRLQERAMRAANETKHTKRPSRKYRRRAKNLLEEFGRRQRPGCPTWLETHVWHAKRFHMTSQWGYKLPLRSNDKGARATHRAVTHFCLMHDISYYSCIELLGPEDTLLKGLLQLCSKETGLTFGAKMYLPGTREGSLILYCANQYPYHAIGPVQFLWKPLLDDEVTRQLWIWVHPACYSEAVTQIGLALGLDVSAFRSKADDTKVADIQIKPTDVKSHKPMNSKIDVRDTTLDVNNLLKTELVQEIPATPSGDKPKRNDSQKQNLVYLELCEIESKKVSGKIEDVSTQLKPCLKRKASPSMKVGKKIKLENESVAADTDVQNVPCLSSFGNGTCILHLLKDALVRFRLQGPRSHATLHEALQVADLPKEDADFWWVEYYRNENNKLAFEFQKKWWLEQKCYTSSACLARGTVVTLTVKDPRLIALPKTKRNVVQSLEGTPSSRDEGTVVLEVSSGPIWNKNARDSVTMSKIPQKELNAMRADLHPFEQELKLGNKENKIPVMLVNKGGMEQSGYGSGYDVILPRDWAMPFWISLVYRGARVCGLQELHRASIDIEQPLFPDHFPDTASGKEHQETQRKEMTTKHYCYPPDKRPNFEKLGVPSPFSPPWLELIQEWSQKQCKSFYVLRNRKALLALTDYLNGLNVHKEYLSEEWFEDALVCVSMSCLFRGVPTEFAALYMLKEEDFFQLTCITRPKGPTETLKKGVEKEKRKSKKAREFIEKRPQVEDLLGQCERKPVGYMEEGRFSFLKAEGAGIGFCAMKALLRVGESCVQHKAKPTVLVRNQNSLQYRFAKIKVLL